MVENVTQIKSGATCRRECKNSRKYHVCGKKYSWDTSTCSCENGKYLGSIIGYSVIIPDETIEVTKAVPTKTSPTKTIPTKTVLIKTISRKAVSTNFNEEKVTCKM